MLRKSKPNELYITRVYEAPVATVWDAWTDPKKAAKWWGPRGHSITTHSKDLRVGGHWAYTMHGPNGEVWENKTVYLEVVDGKRLVYDHGGNDDRPALFRVTVEFKPLGKNKTQMDMTMALSSPEAAKETAKFIKQANGNSTWDRLAEYLDKEDSNNEVFVINRSFSAPIEKVFEMWVHPEHIAQWLPPSGFTMAFQKADVKVGGVSFYSMSGHGFTMYGAVEYLDIQRPHHLAYIQTFRDENGNISRHPGMPTWPEAMHTSVEFQSEEEGNTRITVTWKPEGKVNAAELEAFIKERGGMTQGWTGSFNKLEEALGIKD